LGAESNKVEILEPENPGPQANLFEQAVKASIKNDRLVVDKDAQTIMPLDFSGITKVKTPDPDKYKSKNTLQPTKEEDMKKYFKIYVDYVSKHKTQVQLATEYKFTPTHINRIIKWATIQIGEIDDDQELKVMIDNLKMRKQEIGREKEKLLALDKDENSDDSKESKKIKDSNIDKLAKCWKAETQIDRLLANITKISNNKMIEINNDHRSINCKVSDGFKRRTGSQLTGAERDELPGVEPQSLPAPDPKDQAPIVNVKRGDHASE
jgi:hypothetical protein